MGDGVGMGSCGALRSGDGTGNEVFKGEIEANCLSSRNDREPMLLRDPPSFLPPLHRRYGAFERARQFGQAAEFFDDVLCRVHVWPHVSRLLRKRYTLHA